MHTMKLTIMLGYIFAGTGLFIWLFRKFLRRGLADTGAKRENPVLQNYRLNMKLRSNVSYLIWFISLLIGLFAFAATVAFIVNTWRPFDVLLRGN
jgi:hypothetical protein